MVLYDDAVARTFEPFASTRPWSEVRAGALLVRERWEQVAARKASGFVGADHLSDFRENAAPTFATDALPAGTLLVHSRFAVALTGLTVDADSFSAEGQLVAVRLRTSLDLRDLAEGAGTLEQIARAQKIRSKPRELAGWWMAAPWDLIRHLSNMLVDDIAFLSRSPSAARHTAATTELSPLVSVLGDHVLHVEFGARIEPHTVFDTSHGDILIRRDAAVHAFSRINGPCVVGERSVVSGGKVSTCAIGDVCKVNGEISHSILLGHANKGHDGFVGHSVLGRWVNLGAGTTTSNLKNSYGTVAMWTPAGVADTGLQFLGTLFGDHVKTGIGLCLTTGCVIGAGSNVYDRMPPKTVSPFSWGEGAPYIRYESARFLETAERVMNRRDVALSARMRRHLRRAAERAWPSL